MSRLLELILVLALTLCAPAFAENTAVYQSGDIMEDFSIALESETKAAENATGEVEYLIVVTDEAGAPVQGAMVQICDEGTCLVAATDETGIVKHVAAKYPYEIHLLMAPAGFAADSSAYVLPEEGGKVEIVLKKQ